MSEINIFSRGKSIKFEHASIHNYELSGGKVTPVSVVDIQINHDRICVHFGSPEELIEFCTKHAIEYEDERNGNA